ncbi:MAG: hypothetical protein R3B72_51905 [Polyangiaceae bacterium]
MDQDDDLDFVGADDDALNALLDLDNDDGLEEEIAGLDYEIGADDEDDELDEDDLDDDDVAGEVGRRRVVRGKIYGARARARGRVKARASAASLAGMKKLFKALTANQKKLVRRHKAVARAVQMQRISAAAKAGALPQIFLGVDSAQKYQTGIPANQTVTLAVESTEPLRITNFLVDDAIASDFAVNRIQIGRLNLLAGSHAIPAAMFKSGIERPPMETPMLPAGTEAKIEVTNRASAPRHFLAAFTGIDLSRRDH